MGQGHIRKGFFFYFGLFVLLLITIFLICLVVMIFNPGSTVLWMQYFSGNETIPITHTTDTTEAEIDWNSITDLEINCTYADVTVERDNNREYDRNGLYIFNYAKGFTGAANAVQFDYEVLYDGTILRVNITEPTGFLFFSRDIRIVLHSTTLNQFENFMQNMNITVNTTSGDVDLGGSFNTNSDSPLTSVRSLDISTTSGDIMVSNNLETTALQDLSLETGSGSIRSASTVSYNGGTGSGLQLNCSPTFITDSGTVNINALLVGTNDVSVTCKGGNVVMNYVSANKVDFVASEEGNYVFDEVYADVSFANSEDSIISPNVTAGTIHGNFSLATREGQRSSPDIVIDEIVASGDSAGAIYVTATSGSLTVGSVAGSVEVISSNAMSVDIEVAPNNQNSISITNNSGSIRLAFEGVVSDDVTLRNETGRTSVDITNTADFVADMFVFDAQNQEEAGRERLSDENITINIGDVAQDSQKNPFQIGDGDGQITIFTDRTVTFNLVDASTLA